RERPASAPATRRVAPLRTPLSVLIPVLDDEKHYWVGNDEVEKLLRHGEGWLATHPEREAVTSRYLRSRRPLVRDASSRLVTEEEPDEEDVRVAARDVHGPSSRSQLASPAREWRG